MCGYVTLCIVCLCDPVHCVLVCDTVLVDPVPHVTLYLMSYMILTV